MIVSLFNLGFAVSLLADKTVTIKRYSAATYDAHGRAQARTNTTFTARASVQPLSGVDLKREPEGSNTGDLRSVFVGAELKIGDEIVIGSERLQVERLNEWNSIGGYSKAIARLLDPREV